jgi:hypothetical protein
VDGQVKTREQNPEAVAVVEPTTPINTSKAESMTTISNQVSAHVSKLVGSVCAIMDTPSSEQVLGVPSAKLAIISSEIEDLKPASVGVEVDVLKPIASVDAEVDVLKPIEPPNASQSILRAKADIDAGLYKPKEFAGGQENTISMTPTDLKSTENQAASLERTGSKRKALEELNSNDIDINNNSGKRTCLNNVTESQ